MDTVHRAVTLNSHELLDLLGDTLLCLSELWEVGGHTRNADLVAQVVLDSIRQYEVTISQTLHQRRSTEAVSTVVREVSLTNTEETLHAGLQLIVHPDTTHSIVDSREDHHWLLVWVLVHDLLVHLEEVTIFSLYDILAKALDSVREIEEHSQTGIVDTIALVATLFSCARSYVTWNEVTESWVAALQVVVAILFWDIFTLDLTALEALSVFEFLRNPDTTIVTE